MSVSFNNLPHSITDRIFSYLDLPDRKTVKQINRRFAAHLLSNPAANLVKMEKRSAKIVSPLPISSCVGPTESCMENYGFKSPGLEDVKKFLGMTDGMGRQRILNDSLNPYSPCSEVDKHVQWERRLDPIVEKTACDCIQIERQHGGYVPFYHAMSNQVFCYSLFVRELLATEYENAKDLPLFAPLIRSPECIGVKTVGEYLKLSLNDSSPLPFDWRAAVKKELLSVNPHLFMRWNCETEGTWQLFLNDTSIRPPRPEQFFQMLCQQHGLTLSKRSFDQLITLYEKIAQCSAAYLKAIRPDFAEIKRGIVLQILVPEKIVEEISYPCIDGGELEEGTNPPYLRRLQDLRTNPKARDVFQARILIQSLYVPSHQIKIFVHGGGDFFSDTSFKPVFTGRGSQEALRGCLKIKITTCCPPHHQSNHRQINPRFAA